MIITVIKQYCTKFNFKRTMQKAQNNDTIQTTERST